MQIIHFDKITSTQDHALTLINNSAVNEDMLISASVQTEGRGRLKQRKWVSDYGNFHGSFIINLDNLEISINSISILNTVVMHSVFEFLNNIIGSNIVKIKLPNDIYYNNEKLAGVLIEVVYPFAIIGIGINVYNAPIDTSTSIYEIIKDSKLTNNDNILNNNYGLSNQYCNKLYETILNNLKTPNSNMK